MQKRDLGKVLWIGLLFCLLTSGIAFGALGDRLLSQGSRGEEVRELQSRLIQLGYVVGPLDGIFGPKTEKGVRLFQQERGLPVDGSAGPQTLNELKLMTGESTTAGGTPIGPQNSDVNLLARLVNGEARGEPYLGQVAVAAVVLNRLTDPSFPNTIAEIIYEPRAFSCVDDGQINMAPDSSCLQAAQEAFSGNDPSQGALFFFNPAKTSNKFIWSRPQIIQIGNHIFAR
ncbi:MAG: spore cortex-lytic enzyme [Peptococcaceae bacterium]|jgi:N-acetylmuramoyl-L-alanine amidase|nr:spore cortex-lytic enzyme [Peptococcaceae bacterium]